MSGRIVSAEEARDLRDRVWIRPGSLPLPLWDAAPDLAHTVVVQAEQIAAVLALHARPHWCPMNDGFDNGIYEANSCPTACALGVTA